MSSVVTQGTGRVERYVAQFEALADRRPAGPAWLESRRRAAIARFASLGFPTTRDEEYRFTNIAPIVEADFEYPSVGTTVDRAAIAEHLYGDRVAAELVFVDGRFVSALSSVERLPNGVTAGSLTALLAQTPEVWESSLGALAGEEDSALTALNLALFEDGAAVHIGRNVVVEDPINLVFVTTGTHVPTASYPRVLLVAGEHSQSRVIETHVGLGGGTHFSCAVTEVAAGADSVLDHDRIQIERPDGFHYCRLQVQAARGATFRSHAFSLGGAIVRNDLGAVLGGSGVDCTLNGLYLADGTTVVDNHTTIDHAEPHCGSHEVYKGILGGRARGVFNGKIIVRQDAQKTDAKQTNKALLLSDTAQINTKPQLEIFADDVKCTHGATVGQLDEDALFYLQARGIARADARAILIRGFVGDIVNRVAFGPLRERLDRWLLAQIPMDVTV
jgi:Fe-S cluster assembly protein SufD